MALPSGSPAINAGTLEIPPGVNIAGDQRGSARVGQPDIGACEFSATIELNRMFGGAPVDDLEDRCLSDWFGYYSTAFAPWLFRAQHGFIFRYAGSFEDSNYFFDTEIAGWWWTNQTIYPFVYAFEPGMDRVGTQIGSAWLFYLEGSTGPRVFSVVSGSSVGTDLFFDP